MSKLFVVLLVAAASAAPEAFVPAVAPAEEYVAQPAAAPITLPSSEYQYSYAVRDGLTGDIKDQVERRDGNVVQGRYSLLEPDGLSRRVVDYAADSLNGFNAVVRNEPTAHAVVPAEPVAVATPNVAVASAVRAEPIAYAPRPVAVAAPAVRAEPIAYAPRPVAVAAPAVRAEPIAYAPRPVAVAAPAVSYSVPSVHTDIAYAPVQRSHVTYTPTVRTQAFQPPPAQSSQSITHTTHTLHPQPVVFSKHIENVPSVTNTITHEPVAAITRTEYPITHQVAPIAPVAQAIPTPLTASYLRTSYNPLIHNSLYNYNY